MEVKPGYKQTEVGVIPEEWEVKALPEVSWFQEGPGLRNWQFTNTGLKVINVTNLEDGVLNLDRTDRHISIAEFNRMYRHFAVDAADIVMASSGNSYSKTAVVREQDLPLVMNTSVIRFKPLRSCDYGFLWAILNSPLFKGQIDLMITGGAQPNFGPYHLKRVLVPVPLLPEQRAIATALSDVDALLAGLDGLIAKKRDLKQAAMQQLLAGQTRLPGFHGEWEAKRLGDVVEVRKGQLITGSTKGIGDVPVIAGGKQPAYYHNVANRQGRTITISASGASAGYVALYSTPIFASDCSTIGEGQHYCLEFVFYQLVLKQQLIYKAQTGGAQPHIHPVDVMPIEVAVPSLAEQTAIAAVLTDMDGERAALEARRDKTRDLKQAMMQQLLTGKTRLVPAGAAHA